MAWRCDVVVMVVLVVMVGALAEQKEVPEYAGPIHLPRCCPPGHTLAPDHTCARHHLAEFAPQFMVNTTSIAKAMNVVNKEVTPITCEEVSGHGVMVQVSLVPGEAVLLLQDAVHLLWWPPASQTPAVAGDFCVAAVVGEAEEIGYVARFCFLDTSKCEAPHCVRKCCHEGEELINNMCGPKVSSLSWRPQFSPNTTVSGLEWAFGFPQCEVILVYEDPVLDPQGNLHVPGISPLHHLHYCIDHSVKATVNETTQGDIALACHFPAPTCDWKHKILDPVLMGVSCVFLLITAIVYISVPDLRRSLNGRCILSFITAMFIAFITMIVIRTSLETFATTQCIFTGTFGLFCILATFFWLNILCFRIWCDLRYPSQDVSSTRTFLMLSGYGWGCPALVAILGLTLDMMEANAIRPHFGPPNCWFADLASRWAYQYGLILALMLVNLVLFVWSCITLSSHLCSWKDKRSSLTKHSMMLYVWLIIIMGVTWILEVVSFQINDSCSPWVIAIDIINALQGVYIFMATVFFRKDLKLDGWRWTKVATEDYDTANGHYTSDHTNLDPSPTQD